MTTAIKSEADRGAERRRIVSAPCAAWLAVGLVALLLSVGGQWSLPLAAWIAPVCLVRFSRTSRPAVAIAGVVAASALQMLWVSVEWAVDLYTNALTTTLTLVLGLVFALPYIVDRFVGSHLNGVGRAILFPATVAATEFIVSSNLPVGTSIGVRAVTQSENLPLVQITSLTGAYGIGFLIGLCATVVNHILENPSRATVLRWGGGFLAVLALVVVYGEARLSIAGRSTAEPTVKVAGITPPARLRNQAAQLVTMANYPPSAETRAALATPAMKALYDRVSEELLANTRKAAAAGAQAVVWSENAAPVLEEDKPALLQRIAALARSESIYIDAAISVPFQRNESYLVDPTGAELWHYQKNHPVPGLEPVAPVKNPPPVVNTPFGALSNVICYDGDFPALTRVPADILLVPAWDWPQIGYTHTMKMARLRAIENGYSLFRVDYAGVTAAFDSYGRVLAMQNTAPEPPHTLLADIPVNGVPTLYRRVGDIFAWSCVVVALGLCVTGLARRHRTTGGRLNTSERHAIPSN